jgi:hypothetical protein
VRNAVSSVHNLGALLKSASVKYKVILDLLPELRSSALVLCELFEPASAARDDATRAVGAYGLSRAQDLQRLLDATALANDERDDLTGRANVLATDLAAASDLLALLERAAQPVKTSVSLQLIVRETGRLTSGGRGDDIAVRCDAAPPDIDVDIDPYVVGPLLSLVLALARAAGAKELVVRASRTESDARLTVEPAGPNDAGLPTVAVRVLPPIPPAESTAERVAVQIGAVLDRQWPRGVLRFPADSG